MKKSIRIIPLVVVLQLPEAAIGQPASRLADTWVYSGTDGYVGTQECPDFIVFSADGHYRIDNECSAIDPGRPIAETGRWTIEHEGDTDFLVLSEKSTVAQHDFPGADAVPRMRLLETGTDTLRIEMCEASGTQPVCRVDSFRRWSR